MVILLRLERLGFKVSGLNGEGFGTPGISRAFKMRSRSCTIKTIYLFVYFFFFSTPHFHRAF